MIRVYNILAWIFSFFLLVTFIVLVTKVIREQDNYYPIDTAIYYMTDNIYEHFSKEDVLQTCGQFLHTQDSLNKDINTSLLEDLLLQYPHISKAEVYLDIGNILNIYIYFRHPFVGVLKDNRLEYYDVQGRVLPALKELDRHLLVLSGYVESKNSNYLFELADWIYDDYVLNGIIGGVHYDDLYGYILSSKMCDLDIYLGKELVLNTVKLKLIELFPRLMQEEWGCGYCTSINLKYDNQIICVR